MKTLLKTTIAATALLLASTGFAQDGDYPQRGSGQGKFGPGGQRDMQGMPVIQHFTRAMRRLGLSDEQEQSIRAVMQGLKTEVAPIMGEMEAGHLQLKELIKADQFDENAVAELAATEGDLMAERMVIASRALSEMYGYLTDGQRVQLEEMATTRMERRGEKRRRHNGDG